MKKNLLALLLLVLPLLPVKADEGMWLLPLLKQLNGQKMAEMGFTITPDQIYNINKSSVKDAIVQFGGGCTGEIVSKNGLLFTNHHCGYGSIQKLSSVEHNYLKDGYWAMKFEEELPAKGLSVTFLENFFDVTKEVERATKKSKNSEEIGEALKKLEDELSKKHIGDNKFLEGQLTSFYGGNTYYFIVYKTFKDVRFVGAPPSSIGKFGADTDNWMWPRHTGDFSVFRVYADKDNNPAEYSEENVPYTPKQFLKISLKGVEKGDPTMIMGYPGRTNRFMTRSELVEQRDISNAISIYVRGERQKLMMEDMVADPKVMIQYASKHSGSSNGWKKNIGMNETFNKLGVEQRRAAEEKKFTEWVNAGGKKRIEKYGKSLEKINFAIDSRKEALYNYLYFAESINRIELFNIASRIERIIKENSEDADAAIEKSLTAFYKDYSLPTDRKIAKKMIEIFKDKTPAELHPAFLKVIDTEFGGNVDKYLDDLYSKSVFTSIEKAQKAIKESKEKVLNDPACIAGVGMKESLSSLIPAMKGSAEQFTEGKKEYIAGTLEMRKGEAIYPDANFTMRLTYGSVLPYSPRDAVMYEMYTTLNGVMEKEDPSNWEFVVPDKLKELWKNKDYGQYAMKNGEMPVCFLSNNDITGGNSGSPIMNGNGELIGLAFDGNWESMSGDIIFEPELQRCINVDVRYVLFIIDKFGGAGYLLDEMELVK